MITDYLPNEVNQTLNEIELLVGSEKIAIKKSIEVLPAFTLFHNLMLQFLVAENPAGGINFETGVPQFQNYKGRGAKKRKFLRKLEDIIAVLTINNPNLEEIGVTVENGGKYFEYATGGPVVEVACDIARRCSYSLGCYYNLDVIEFSPGEIITIGREREFLGRHLDHSRPQMHGGTDDNTNKHYMCSYHNIQMKNGNPFFDVNTLYGLFFS